MAFAKVCVCTPHISLVMQGLTNTIKDDFRLEHVSFQHFKYVTRVACCSRAFVHCDHLGHLFVIIIIETLKLFNVSVHTLIYYVNYRKAKYTG